MKNTPENMFVLFILRVGKFWRREKKDKITANATLTVADPEI